MCTTGRETFTDYNDMEKREMLISGKRCFVFADDAPEVLLVEAMDLRDLEFLDRETDALKASARKPFALATLIIEDWNRELSPWQADPVFGKEPFGDGAAQTLRLIEAELIPKAEEMFPSLKGGDRILGGYSLSPSGRLTLKEIPPWGPEISKLRAWLQESKEKIQRMESTVRFMMYNYLTGFQGIKIGIFVVNAKKGCAVAGN